MIKFKPGDKVIINPIVKGKFRFQDLKWWDKNKDKIMTIDNIVHSYTCTVRENISYWCLDWLLKAEEKDFFKKEEFEI